MGKNKYSQKDAQKDTGASKKQAKQAWHDARDDASREKGWRVPKNRHSKKSK